VFGWYLVDIDFDNFLQTHGLQQLELGLSLTQLPVANSQCDMFSLSRNSGWAGQVIDSWVSMYKEEAARTDDNVTNTSMCGTSAANFCKLHLVCELNDNTIFIQI
jgi:hypothetical protein